MFSAHELVVLDDMLELDEAIDPSLDFTSSFTILLRLPLVWDMMLSLIEVGER